MPRPALAIVLTTLAAAVPAAQADNLSVPVQKHTATCPAPAACIIRKPAGVGGWELLSKDIVLEEKGEGLWQANFSRVKGAAPGKSTVLQVLAADGSLIQVEVKFLK